MKCKQLTVQFFFKIYTTSLSLKGLFPLSLLPEVVGVPHMAGGLVSEWHGVPSGTRISVAMGDMQCSVLAAKPTLTDIGNTSHKDFYGSLFYSGKIIHTLS